MSSHHIKTFRRMVLSGMFGAPWGYGCPLHPTQATSFPPKTSFPPTKQQVKSENSNEWEPENILPFIQSAPKNPARRLSSAVDLVIEAAHGVRGGVAEVSREWRMIMETRGALIRQPRRWIHQARRVKAADGSPDSHAPTAFYLLLLFAAVAYSSFPLRETCMIGWPEWRLISKPAFVGTKRAAPPTSSSFFPPRLLSLRAQEKREWGGRERKRGGGGWRGSSVTTRGAAFAWVRAGLLYYLDRPASACFTFDIFSPFCYTINKKKQDQ